MSVRKKLIAVAAVAVAFAVGADVRSAPRPCSGSRCRSAGRHPAAAR